MTDFIIGSDLLDIGSRKAEVRRREQMAPERAILGMPTEFAVPPVADVSLFAIKSLN